MNKYGKQAMEHWTQWAPERVAQLENPVKFFEELGEEVETEILDLAEVLAGPDSMNEQGLDKLRRLKTARFQAENQVLRERVLIAPHEDKEQEVLDPESVLRNQELQAEADQWNEELDQQWRERQELLKAN